MEAKRQMVDRAMQSVYHELNRRFDDGNQDTIEALRRLQDAACIWTGKTFCRPEIAVLHSDYDYTPALHNVAPWLIQYQALLLFLGVRDVLQALILSCLAFWVESHFP